MLEVYINSKGEETKISEMQLRHLLFTIAKNSRAIGQSDTSEIKREEVKAMHEEVLRRFAELSKEEEK